jgi:uncharacterized protein YpmB
MQEILQKKHQKPQQVKMVLGKEQGKPAWYVLCVERIKLPIYQHMMRTGKYDLQAVGQVLYSGWGNEVPPSIMARVKEQFS